MADDDGKEDGAAVPPAPTMADDGEEDEVGNEDDEPYPLNEDPPHPPDMEDNGGGATIKDSAKGSGDAAVPTGTAAAPASATTVPLMRAASSTEYSRAAVGGKVVSIPAADLHGEVEARMAYLTNRYCMTPDEALVLLLQTKWRVERINEAWAGDEGRVRAKVGMAAGGDPPPLPAGVKATDIHFDEVSLEEFAYADADACACGHWAPKEVWRTRLQAAMENPTAAFGTLVRYTGSNLCISCNPRLVT